MAIIGVLAFVVALLLSVMIHEAGHYLTAKKFGMKVTEFFLGFGQKIWSTQRGETEFGIKAIPSGMAKSPASVQGLVMDAKALRFAETSSVWIGLALFPQSLRM